MSRAIGSGLSALFAFIVVAGAAACSSSSSPAPASGTPASAPSVSAGAPTSAAASTAPSSPQATTGGGACGLLSPADIAQTTGMKFGNGTPHQVSSKISTCRWGELGGVGPLLTLSLMDTQSAKLQVAAGEGIGTPVAGIGSKAVISSDLGVGSFVFSAVDSKGGIGITIRVAKGVTTDQVIALAKLVESRR